MGVMDKFLEAIRLNGDDDSTYYDEDDFNSAGKIESINNNNVKLIAHPGCFEKYGDDVDTLVHL